jgi:hypothetical protein
MTWVYFVDYRSTYASAFMVRQRLEINIYRGVGTLHAPTKLKSAVIKFE